MNETFQNLTVIKYQDEYGLDKFEIGGFDPDKSSSISFEKIDPKYGEVIDVMSEKELDAVLGDYGYRNIVSKKNEIAAIWDAYAKAKENDFLNVAVYEAGGAEYRSVSMKKGAHFYRAVLGDGRDTFLVDGRPMNDKEKFDLFYTAQKVLGDQGMQKFNLVSYRNAVIEGARRTVVAADTTVKGNSERESEFAKHVRES